MRVCRKRERFERSLRRFSKGAVVKMVDGADLESWMMVVRFPD